jgi:diguanylate cyclase (GGDEF)-like protein/PAS domain S-box-containing protein
MEVRGHGHSRTFRPGPPRTIALAAVLFSVVTALRFAAGDDTGGGISFLYALPIAVVAVGIGISAGLVSAATALLLFGVWDALAGADVGPLAYGTRGASYMLLAVVVGLLERERRRQEDINTRWFEMSNDMLCEADFDGYFTRVNDQWQEQLGWDEDELLGRPYADLIHPDDLASTAEAAAGLAAGPSQVVDFENRYRANDRSWRWLLWSARSDQNRIYAVAKDITQRKRLEAEREQLLGRVETLARTDQLTELPNRRAWDEELRREIARCRREGGRFAVALLDLDHFKAFNDRDGHQAGDDLLRKAAENWRRTLRITDFIARYGGEEFAILLPGCPPASAELVIDRVRAATPEGQTCSAGIATWDGEEPAESVVGRADEALYAAKQSGRDRTALAHAA